MADKEIAGVRHLVASAVAGLSPESVTIVDGRGTVLAGDTSPGAKAVTEQRDIERTFEQRIVDLLEPPSATGSVVAKVSASFDSSRGRDDQRHLRSRGALPCAVNTRPPSRASRTAAGPAGVAGAAANQPLAGCPAAAGAVPAAAPTTRGRDQELRDLEDHHPHRDPGLRA